MLPATRMETNKMEIENEKQYKDLYLLYVELNMNKIV